MSALRRLVVLVMLLLSAAALGAAAAAADPSGDAKVDNVTTSPGEIQFVLSTPSDAGQLQANSIVVTVEGQTLESSAAQLSGPQPSQGAAPIRAVYLVLDTSGSMAGDGITGARAAAQQYASTLPKDVLVGLVTFSDAPHLILRATTDRASLGAALAGIRAGGNTALYDGVIAAAKAMEALPSSAEKRLLILSDGADTTSRSSESAATNELRSAGVSADVVAFRLPGDQKVLDDIAQSSGGKVLPASSAGDLASAFSTAAQAFRQQLLVTVKVPGALAGTSHLVTVTANAGASTLTATTTILFPVAAPNAAAPKTEVTVAAANSTSTQLWLVVGIAFAGLLALALTALFLPVLAAARAQKSARLAEMHRYRVVTAMGAQPMAGPRSDESTTTALTQRTLSFVDRAMRARGKRERVVSELERAGLRIRPEEWAIIQVAGILVPAAVFAALAGFVGFLIGAVVGFAAIRLFVLAKVRKRAEKFNDQLPDTLQLLAGSLRTGFSLNQAVAGVVREGTEPMASELSRALTETRLGADLEDALEAVAERMRCEDLHWVVMAVRISREVGGNLAEVLQTTTTTMRQRAELRGQVRVLSAEGRMSARILTGLPFLLAGFLAMWRPGYLKPLVTQPVGVAMLIIGAILLAVGTFWLSRLTKIKV